MNHPLALPNVVRVAELRDLVDQLYLAASGTIDPKTARLAANELAKLADALEAGGATCDGYAAVPLIEQPYGARPDGSARSIEECT